VGSVPAEAEAWRLTRYIVACVDASNLSGLPVWINSPVVANALTAAATLIAVPTSVAVTARIASSGRNHSKRLAIIDLAKKRLELRDQILKLELAAAKGAAKEREAKQRAQTAVQGITSDANLMMKQLEWRDQITRVQARKPHKLTSKPLKGSGWFMYWLATLVSWGFIVFIVYYLLELALKPSIPRTPGMEVLVVAVRCTMVLIFCLAYLHFSSQARQIKFPKPDGPILDEI